tara:strand:+ start:7563 stop:9071 length:1509 start_codon:yes stop_codon:yes gene_type:complete
MYKLSLFFILISNFVFTQKSLDVVPYSLANQIKVDFPQVDFPQVDLEKLLIEDEARENWKPYRYGKIFEVDYNFNNSGSWEPTKDGGRLWRLSIRSEGAYAISIEFDNFVLEEGSHLFVYDRDYEMILGAYTEINNHTTKEFATPLLKGDIAVIEFYEPSNSNNISTFRINKVIHDYRDIMNFYNEDRDWECGVNVICETEEVFQGPIDAVAYLDMGGWICSGAMVNNVNFDLTPYFLTAWHCTLGENPSTFRFYFNKEASSCESTWGSAGPYAYSSTQIADAGSMDSDWALLLITDDIEDDWDVYYAGWDVAGNVTSISSNIHHPGGDPKKINYDDDNATSHNSTVNWGAGYGTAPPHTYWKVFWDEGGTEGGSSGSPLYDNNFRIVGPLSGGNSDDCVGGYSLYGKLSRGWEGDEPNSRLKDWLDPDDTNTLYIDGTYDGFQYTLGDINYDEEINIFDVIELINIILTGEASQESLLPADLNEDGNINIYDIISIVNLII